MSLCCGCRVKEAVVGVIPYCSVECARWALLIERFKKLEGVLIEIKYAVQRLER